MEAATTSRGRALSRVLLELFEVIGKPPFGGFFLLREIFLAQEIAYDFFYVAVLAVDGVI